VTACTKPFRLAVASGKGGTGKTTLSVALALSAAGKTSLLDCDVEEPNAALFLGGTTAGARIEEIMIPIPEVSEEKCTACGACVEVCMWSALALLKDTLMIFPELCHGCGACVMECTAGALTEKGVPIGTVAVSEKDNLRFVQGELKVGFAMSPPLIRAVKKRGGSPCLVIVDCPPGTSCPMITAVRGADFVLLVTEPTPFGLHDLILAVATVRKAGLPFGVVINRADSGDDRVRIYCAREGIPILLEIPDDRRVAEAYSRGGTLLSAAPEYGPMMADLLETVFSAAGSRAVEEGRK